MSIVRVGMSEDGKFAEGYEAIFGTKKSEKTATAKKPAAKKPAKKPAVKAKKKK